MREWSGAEAGEGAVPKAHAQTALLASLLPRV